MSWAGEVRGRHDWYPNSYRFDTENEAKLFIERGKEQWIPKGFIWTTRVLWAKEPTNARWNDKKKEAVRLTVTELATVVVKDEPDEDEAAPHNLVDEVSYRSRKKLPRRIINREAYRSYKDETRWLDREQRIETPLNHTPKGYGILSDAIRHDLRHLIAHGKCRYELSQRLYDFYKDAHDGKVAIYSTDQPKSKRRPVVIRTVDMKMPENLLDLTRWLATPEGHAYTGWYSFGKWHGPAKLGAPNTMKDLIAALDLEDAERAAQWARRREGLAKRLALFESMLNGTASKDKAEIKKLQTLKQQRLEKEYEGKYKCKLPDLKKFVTKHGGDYSRISFKAWDSFNQEIENWKTCIQCDDHWSDPQWRQWYQKKTIEIWGDS
jgi:hypothetical protein